MEKRAAEHYAALAGKGIDQVPTVVFAIVLAISCESGCASKVSSGTDGSYAGFDRLGRAID